MTQHFTLAVFLVTVKVHDVSILGGGRQDYKESASALSRHTSAEQLHHAQRSQDTCRPTQGELISTMSAPLLYKLNQCFLLIL